MPTPPDAPDPAAALAAFGPATRAWFSQAFAAPTPVQVAGWTEIAAGRDTLMLAPTGSGKTLAAFLWCLDRLAHRDVEELDPPGVRVLYVSPMKALVYDVDRNLRTPLAGIRAAAVQAGRPVRDITVSVRTGDTPAAERRRFQRAPGHVLVTTPESLYLLLSSRARAALATVRTVIIDEIHAVAGTKRGVHLALSLERLAELVTRPAADGTRRPPPQRIGLSATQRPLSEIAAFLGGADASGQPRPVAIVDRSAPPDLDLRIVVPVDDMDNPAADPGDGAVPGAEAAGGAPPTDGDAPGGVIPADSSMSADHLGIWPAIHRRLLRLVLDHRSTILFTNSRRLCERIAQRLNELAEEAGVAVP
ncbi:MAG: DEAD/DEAH box helicase, partial [Deltaproteobacteria bacterium]